MMEQTININGADIFVKDVGQGVPLLMLHGSPDTAEMWEPLMERLKDKVRCIAMDLPGFGRSTMPDNFDLAVDNLAEFMKALLDKLNIQEPVYLLSADFGTHYAQAFLVKYPERVRGSVVSNSTFHHDYHWHGFAKLYRIPVLGEFLINTPKAMLKSSLKQFAPALPDWYVDQSYPTGFGSSKVRKTILRMYRERNPAKDFVGWDEKSKKLMQEKPSMVLWGDRDPFAASTFADKFGAQQVHHFQNFSHWLPLEAPDAYAEKLIPWLAQA
jgi:haloalkane dehalogenase